MLSASQLVTSAPILLCVQLLLPRSSKKQVDDVTSSQNDRNNTSTKCDWSSTTHFSHLTHKPTSVCWLTNFTETLMGLSPLDWPENFFKYRYHFTDIGQPSLHSPSCLTHSYQSSPSLCPSPAYCKTPRAFLYWSYSLCVCVCVSLWSVGGYQVLRKLTRAPFKAIKPLLASGVMRLCWLDIAACLRGFWNKHTILRIKCTPFKLIFIHTV